MDIIPRHPRAIQRFIYERSSKRLHAFFLDGHVTICEGIPAELVLGLRNTLTAEEFFRSYITSQYDCRDLQPMALRRAVGH